MSLPQLLVILRVHRKLTLRILFITVLLAIVGTKLVAKQYTATGAVLVDIKSPDPVAGVVLPSALAPGYMSTEVDLMSSERVARRAITLLGLENDAEMRAKWEADTKGVGDYMSWLTDLLQLKLDIKPSRDSGVVSYSYVSGSPEFASMLVNAFMQAYIDTTAELRVERARTSNNFFDERAKQLRDNLEQAQSRLAEYQRNARLITTDEQLDVENARLAALTNQLVQLQTAGAQVSSRLRQAGNADVMSEAMSNPVVSALTTAISQGEADARQLAERLGPEHPALREARAKLTQLREQRDLEVRRVIGALNVDGSSSDDRIVTLQRLIDEQRNRLLELKSRRDEAAVLKRDVESAQRAYDAVLARVGETSLASQNTMTNVTIVKYASTPPVPSGPKLGRNLGLGIFVGLMFGVMASIARELLDRRIHTPEDIAVLLRQPVLGVIPPPLAPPTRLRRIVGRLPLRRFAAPRNLLVRSRA
ncbi:chain length determinant protein EpsF [Derxia gummosa]|uniref:Chain length determinant protein EpsF n=1 Tax=Derxia gummosa DSM 723 TaxID=1121388 RepID=A0A8B6X8W6_9BURK|nr:chain length determinant protein EpsF [Derxia gummosa]